MRLLRLGRKGGCCLGIEAVKIERFPDIGLPLVLIHFLDGSFPYQNRPAIVWYPHFRPRIILVMKNADEWLDPLFHVGLQRPKDVHVMFDAKYTWDKSLLRSQKCATPIDSVGIFLVLAEERWKKATRREAIR